MYAYAAEAQPSSPTHGGTAYIQPLAASIMNSANRNKRGIENRKKEQVKTLSEQGIDINDKKWQKTLNQDLS